MKAMHRKLLAATLLGAASLIASSARAAINVLACEPEWQALTEELGGDKVKVSSATNALQDPHRIEARPGLIARTRNADLLVCTGLELEVGWLPVLIQQSGNARIATGQPGHFEAGAFVPRLDVPGKLDRSQGDVHAAGNPHIQTDPRNIAAVAAALATRLQQIDAPNAANYAQRAAAFAQKWQQALARWNAQAAPLRGLPVASQHKGYVYLYDWLGLREVAVLEPRPGVEPSVSYLQEVLARLKATPARMVLHSPYQDPRPSEWLARNAGIPVVKVPFTVGGSEQATDLYRLFDDTIARLLAAASQK
jgi:zinc/manganese transport system substrate-binding protein